MTTMEWKFDKFRTAYLHAGISIVAYVRRSKDGSWVWAIVGTLETGHEPTRKLGMEAVQAAIVKSRQL